MTRFSAAGHRTVPRFRDALAALSGGALFVAVLLAVGDLAALQDDMARRRREFDSASGAVGKAKKLPKLGDAHFAAARKAMHDSDYVEAVRLLKEYLDLVSTTRDALLATVANPEKKPGGFKQMEIHVRKSLDWMSDIIADSPLNEREAFEAIRAELEKLNKHLVRDLFPRQPGNQQTRSKP